MDSPQAESTDWTIYQGPWINWSDGIFLGATLTTSTREGLILVSFLAIWVSLVSGSVWRITCFILHQLRGRKNTVQDGLFYQEQAVLRNSDSAGATFLELLHMGWAWRGRANYSVWRVLPLAIIAGLQVAVFIAAGIFSSEIFSTNQEVLVRSHFCGTMELPKARAVGKYSQKEFAMWNAAMMEMRTSAQFALTYSRSCYGSNPVPNCNNLFAVSSLPSSDNIADCPFDPEVCLLQKNAAIRVDSGYVNSNLQLGINSKADDSIDYRRVTTCAPLKTDGYKAVLTVKKKAEDLFSGGPYLGYYYGPNKIADADWTFLYDAYVANNTGPYEPISAYWSYAGGAPENWSVFEPYQQLNRTDGDVTILLVANNIGYSSPTKDAWYYATTKGPDSSNLGRHTYSVDPQFPAIAMGCVEQHQICDPNLPRDEGCTPLTGWVILREEHVPSMNSAQKTLKNIVQDIAGTSQLHYMISNLGTASLLASKFLQSSLNRDAQPLAEDFWHQEVRSWQALLMAWMQKYVVNVAQGPANEINQKFVRPLPEKYTEHFDMCSSVKIRDGHFYSFKILGLLITILGGFIILLLDLSLPWIIGKIQLASHKGIHRKEDWELDHLLQIQRMAFEGSKQGNWIRNEDGVPVTLRNLGMQKFDKPGRGTGMYEALEMVDTKDKDVKAWHGQRESDTEYLRPFHSRAMSDASSLWQSQQSEQTVAPSIAPSFVSTEYGRSRGKKSDPYFHSSPTELSAGQVTSPSSAPAGYGRNWQTGDSTGYFQSPEISSAAATFPPIGSTPYGGSRQLNDSYPAMAHSNESAPSIAPSIASTEYGRSRRLEDAYLTGAYSNNGRRGPARSIRDFL